MAGFDFIHCSWDHSSCLGLCYSTGHWEMLPQSWLHLQCPYSTRVRTRTWKKCLGQHSADFQCPGSLQWVCYSWWPSGNDLKGYQKLKLSRKYKVTTILKKEKNKKGEKILSQMAWMIMCQQLALLHGSTTAADESEIIHTSNQFLHVQLHSKRLNVLRNKLLSGAIDALNNLEQFILDSKLINYRKQTNIVLMV